jgi:hypothetical protein
MKKLTVFLSLIISSLFLTNSIAAPVTMSGYSAQVFKGLTPSFAAASFHPFTDITIVNASSNTIYMVVPNSPVDQGIAPGYNGHIHNNDSNNYNTYVVLLDPSRQTFYAKTVCRLAILTVRGYQGSYSINEDFDLCS